MELPREWWLGLERWVLQDGNYTDFEAGERRQFALEFGYARAKRLKPAAWHERRCRHTGRTTTYDVTGQLLRSATEPRADAFVLDVGLRAYKQWLVLDDLAPPGTGAWLTGEISLYVDHFAYMDELALRPGMSPLIHTWTVDEIQISTTPLMRVGYGHPLYSGPEEGSHRVAAPDRESWRTIERTRMWDDDRNYRLRCTLEDVEPTSSMAASGPRSPYGPLK